MKENTQEMNQVENQKIDETITLSLSKNVKTIVIDGIRFEMDLDDPDVFKALLEFKENHNDHPANIETDDDGLLDDCADVIDTVLGEGTCSKLFKGPDMKMYLLVNELAKIYLDNFMKEEREAAEARNKEEMERLKEIINSMTKIADMAKYADNKYGNKNRGMRNYVRNNKSFQKYKNKKK